MRQPRREVFEEDVPLQRYVAEAEVCDGLRPSHGDEQEPPERQRHMHITQQRIDSEDAAVEERFADDLARSPQGRRRGQAPHDPHLVGMRQTPQPHAPLTRDHGEHHRSADDERQTKRCVESHGQKSPNLRLMSSATPRVLMPRGHTSRHLPHNIHLFISS